MERLQRISTARQMAADGTARQIREDARISQIELASEIGVIPATLCRWETGQRSPRGTNALRYLEALELLQASDG